MRDLNSSIKRSFLDPEQPDSVSVHGEQVWQFWRGDKLIVNVLRMANPSLTIQRHSVLVDSTLHISWDTQSSGPVASLMVPCLFTIEIEGLRKVRQYQVEVNGN